MLSRSDDLGQESMNCLSKLLRYGHVEYTREYGVRILAPNTTSIKAQNMLRFEHSNLDSQIQMLPNESCSGPLSKVYQPPGNDILP